MLFITPLDAAVSFEVKSSVALSLILYLHTASGNTEKMLCNSSLRNFQC